MRPPKLVTKYCTPSTARSILAGRFKFGTLEGYRGLEAAGRFSDEMEGRFRSEHHNLGDIKHAKLHSNVFSNIEASPGAIVYLDQVNYQAWVFCASCGPFDQITFNALRRGTVSSKGEKYVGDQGLTSWVTYDVERLMQSLRFYLQRKIKAGNIRFQMAKVQYGEKHVVGRPLTAIEYLANDPFRNFAEAVFRKPTMFMPENEFRIVAVDEGRSISEYTDLFLDGEGLKLSCVAHHIGEGEHQRQGNDDSHNWVC